MIPSAEEDSDATAHIVGLYRRLSGALSAVDDALAGYRVVHEEAQSCVNRIRALCAELEHLLEVCDEDQGNRESSTSRRIRSIDRQVVALLANVQALIERGHDIRISPRWER